MGTSTVSLQPAISAPDPQLTTDSSVATPQWKMSLGDNAKVGDIIEAEFTLSTDTGFNNTLGTQTAVVDAPGLTTGLLDWTGEPILENGTYIYRFRARRPGGQKTRYTDPVTVTITANYGVDTVPPVLTNPGGTTTGDTTATFSITTDKPNGKLYYTYQQTASAPTAASIIAVAPYIDITSAGTKSIDVAGLTKGGNYYPVFVHVSESGFASTVVVGELFTTTDSTPPVISGAVFTALTPTTAELTFFTDQPNGTASVVVTASATQPSATNIEAGNDHTGTPVSAGRFKAKSSGITVGAIIFNVANGNNFSGLTADAAQYAHMVHRDELGQVSNILTKSVTMPAAADVTAPTLTAVGAAAQSNTTAVVQFSTNEGAGTAYLELTTTNSAPTAAHIVANGTSKTITTAGLQTYNVTGLTADQTYYAWIVQDDAVTPTPNRSAVLTAGSFTTTTSALKALTVESVHLPDATKPQFIIRGSLAQVGDEFRLSWDLPTSGFVDATLVSADVTGDGIGGGWKFTWTGVPDFPKNTAITFTIRHKRGSDSVSANKVVTFLDTPAGTPSPGPSDPPPPPPAPTPNYLVRKDTTSKYRRKDNVSFLLRN